MSLVTLSTFDLSHLSSQALVREGGVTVDADATIVVHIVLFLVLMFALKPMLFDPLMKLFAEREERTLGTKKAAAAEDAKSAKARASYEAEMVKARAEGNVEREKIRAAGLATESEILAKVRASSAETLERGRARVAEEVATARKVLSVEGASLGRELASRVLGREVRG